MFKHNDAGGVAFVDELFSLFVVLVYRLGDDFTNYLTNVMLPNLERSTMGVVPVSASMSLVMTLEQAAAAFADAMTLQSYDTAAITSEHAWPYYEYCGMPHSLPQLRNHRTFFRTFVKEIQSCISK